MTRMLKRILGEDITMRLHYAPQPAVVLADTGMMEQLVLNMVVNSRDAMPRGGQLDIETAVVQFDERAAAQMPQGRPGSFVCLSVSDTGCGIPQDVISRIFDPFFTTKDVGKGTGLGLATVYGIVQQHQGWINLGSEVGKGTTFRIYLPRSARIPEEQPARLTQVSTRGGNETILLAEDEPSLRCLVRNVLKCLGYEVLEASTGVKALELWQQHRDQIRLLLTDMVMPDGVSGTDLAQRLHEHNPRLQVIYISGYSADIAGRDFVLEAGVNFLAKPFNPHELAELVRDCLDKPSPA
jgi:CheY-like chemotaxis protein